MAQGMMTEREWRKQAERGPRGRRCWGALCVQPRQRPMHDRRLLAGMLATAVMCAALLPLFAPADAGPETYRLREELRAAERPVQARKISTVDYWLPEEIETESKSFSREELLRGKMLFLDEEHPLPYGVPAPNTMSVAGYGKGMVPVSDLTVRSGMETISALTGLFAALRGQGVGCFTVCRGTMTPWEQEAWRLGSFRKYASRMTLDAAAARALAETDDPGQGQMLQEYTVELCLTGDDGAEKPMLEASTEGRKLLQTAWRYGFVVEQKRNRWLLRYVGKAHAAAMVFLDVELEEYLHLLHEKRILQVRLDETTTYLIFCQPAEDEYVEFLLPKNVKYEVSLDNLGYALAACAVET